MYFTPTYLPSDFYTSLPIFNQNKRILSLNYKRSFYTTTSLINKDHKQPNGLLLRISYSQARGSRQLLFAFRALATPHYLDLNVLTRRKFCNGIFNIADFIRQKTPYFDIYYILFQK